MDEWNPEPEQRVDAAWLAHEHERLQREEAIRRDANDVDDGNEKAVNGSSRSADGRFKNLPDHVSRTDGSAVLSSDEFEETLLRIRDRTRVPRPLGLSAAFACAAAIRRLCDELEYEAVAYARGHG